MTDEACGGMILLVQAELDGELDAAGAAAAAVAIASRRIVWGGDGPCRRDRRHHRFDGRVDFAPPVRDVAAQGFALVGGRLDYLDGHAAAALVYRHDRHLIDVFIWPGSGPVSEQQVQGYNVEGWSQAGINFRAVSDLNTAELGDLTKLLRTPG